MNKALIVFRHELRNALRNPAFLVTLILLPVISFLVLFLVSRAQNNAQVVTPTGSLEELHPEVLGFIDQSGMIQMIPSEISAQIRQFPNAEAAEAALKNGEIASFLIIPVDYLSTGMVTVYRPEFNPFSGMEASGNIKILITANLLRDDPQTATLVNHPFTLETEFLSTVAERDPNSGLTFLIPYLVTFLIYILILVSSSLLLNGIAKEKENRVMELLITSLKPVELLTGKITALGLVGLLQTIVWSTAGLLMLRFSGQAFAVPQIFQLPASILVWVIVFFLEGYVIYASLMAGVGVLVPNLRESSTATMLVITPLIIPLVFISALIDSPNSPFLVFLSFFPLTSPVTMITRIAATHVPAWQPLLSVLIGAFTAVIIVRAVAGMFRANNLLSGQGFKFKVYLQALIGRL